MNEHQKNRCLIDLEVIEEKPDPPDTSFDKNDTFTDLAFRDSRIPLGGSQSQSLPTPEEVIPLVRANDEKQQKENDKPVLFKDLDSHRDP